jgi:hypothetical protein
MRTQDKHQSFNIEQLQRAYQADQQLKYMSLQAELELLLQQIKTGNIK